MTELLALLEQAVLVTLNVLTIWLILLKLRTLQILLQRLTNSSQFDELANTSDLTDIMSSRIKTNSFTNI